MQNIDWSSLGFRYMKTRSHIRYTWRDGAWNKGELVTDDHVPFLDKGFRAIDLIDFSYGPNNSYWHTDKDTMENVSEASLLASGKVVVEMLNILL